MIKFAVDFFKENLKTKLLGREIDFYEKLDSTNTFVLNRSSKPGYVVVASQQASGKGKVDKPWFQFDDALSFSISLPLLPVHFLLPINIIAGYTVVDIMRSQFTPLANMKWPNDILINGKKVCGMLINAKFNGNALERIVLGVGINISGQIPDELSAVATTLDRHSSRSFYPEVFLAQFCNKFEQYLNKLQLGGIDIRAMWKDYSAHKGKQIIVTINNNKIKYAEFGIDLLGNLIVLDDRTRSLLTITNGDIGYDFSS